MRAFDPEVVDTVWAGIEPLLPIHSETHPLGCHRPRLPDRDCFEVMLVRLVTGCSWEDAEHLCANKVSDTTARARRDEWIDAGVFDAIASEAVGAYDKIMGLDLSEVAVDGSLHKSPVGGEGTGKNRPIGPSSVGSGRCSPTEGGSPSAGPPMEPTATTPPLRAHLLAAIELGCWSTSRPPPRPGLRQRQHPGLCRLHGIDDLVASRQRRTKSERAKSGKLPVPLGMRWPVERSNSWLSNFGALRRNTDRKITHRLAQLALAITFLLVPSSSTGEIGGAQVPSLSAEPLRATPDITISLWRSRDSPLGRRRTGDTDASHTRSARRRRVQFEMLVMHSRHLYVRPRWCESGHRQLSMRRRPYQLKAETSVCSRARQHHRIVASCAPLRRLSPWRQPFHRWRDLAPSRRGWPRNRRCRPGRRKA